MSAFLIYVSQSLRKARVFGDRWHSSQILFRLVAVRADLFEYELVSSIRLHHNASLVL